MTTDTATRAPTSAVYVLGLIAGLQMADPTIVNVILVQAGRELSFTPAQAALAASISTLALAATVLASGLVADRIGRRRLLVAAMVLAAVGDIIAACTPVTLGFLIGRALAGIGLGAALAACFAYVRYVSTEEKVGENLGLWNAVMLVVMLVGTLFGGALATVSWRAALLLVPVAVLLLLLPTMNVLPPMPRVKEGRVDYLGLITVGASTVLFLYGVSQAAKSLTAPDFLIPTALGILGFALFAIIELKVSSPVFPIKLFLKGIFLAAVLAGIVWNFGQAVFQLASSNWWQWVSGSSTLQVSLLQLPFMIVIIVVSVLVGRMLSARPQSLQPLLMGGYALMVLGFLASAVATVDGEYWWIIPGSLVLGIGLVMVAVPQSLMFVAVAPARFFGAVTSFRTTVGQIGFALGLSGSVVLIQVFSNIPDMSTRLLDAGVPANRVGRGIDKVQEYYSGEEPTGDLADVAIEQAQRAYSHGFDMTMVISAIFIALLGVLTWLALRRHRKQLTPARPQTEDAIS